MYLTSLSNIPWENIHVQNSTILLLLLCSMSVCLSAATSFRNAAFGQGSGPINLDNVFCRGSTVAAHCPAPSLISTSKMLESSCYNTNQLSPVHFALFNVVSVFQRFHCTVGLCIQCLHVLSIIDVRISVVQIVQYSETFLAATCM